MPKKDHHPFLVDAEQYKVLRAYAEKTGQSVAAVSREVVSRFLAKHADRPTAAHKPSEAELLDKEIATLEQSLERLKKKRQAHTV